MVKIRHLGRALLGLAALFAFSTGAKADAVSENTTYYLKNASAPSYYVTSSTLNSTEALSAEVQLGSGTSIDNAVTFTFAKTETSDVYYIYATNVVTGSNNYVVYSEMTSDKANIVRVSATASTAAEAPSNAMWKVTAGNSGLMLQPYASESSIGGSWNMYGSNGSNIGIWTATGASSQWTALTPTDLCQTMTTALTNAIATATTNNTLGTLGYPTAGAASTFTSTVSSLLSEVTKGTKTISEFTSAYNTAVSTLDASLVLPTDGSVYKISVVYPDDTSQALYWDSSLSTPRIAGLVSPTDTRSSYFFCHKTDAGKFVFVNKDGKYLSFFDSGSDADSSSKGGCANGASDVYGANVLWTLERASATQTGSAGNIATGTTDETLFGRLQMKNESGYFLTPRYEADVSTACAFISSNSLDKWYDYSESSNGKMRSYTFKFEEVSTDDICLINIADGRNYATFSAPFPVTLPTNLGLTAYTATASNYTAGDGTEAGTLTLTPIDGTTIPENTGVLLYNESGKAVTTNLAPAEDATATTAATTGLVPTGGDDDTEDITTETGYSYYVFGQPSGKEVGFWPLSTNSGDKQFKAFKAYLVLLSTENSSIKLAFGKDSTTGISAATLIGSDNAPVYDLTGRRVAKTVKGNIYLKNGKKYLAR